MARQPALCLEPAGCLAGECHVGLPGHCAGDSQSTARDTEVSSAHYTAQHTEQTEQAASGGGVDSYNQLTQSNHGSKVCIASAGQLEQALNLTTTMTYY